MKFIKVGCPFRKSEPTMMCHGIDDIPLSLESMERLIRHVEISHDTFYKDKGIPGREEERKRRLDLRQLHVLREALGYDENFVSVYP